MNYKAYKYRIYPNKEQAEQMEKTFGCTRFLYNKCIEWNRNAYKLYKETGQESEYKYAPLVTYFKEQFPFLKEVDNAALAYSRDNFIEALRNFIDYTKGKTKLKYGYPNFKSRGKCPFRYRTCASRNWIHFSDDDKYIKLPKLGMVKVVRHRTFKEQIKAVTIERKKSMKYYISVYVETKPVKPVINKIRNSNNLNVVGIDMSLSDFAISSNEVDNTITKYVRNFRLEERRLAKLSRSLSRKKASSKNRDKARIKLARLHEKISNRRRDFIIKTALYYSRKYDVVMLEDINMKNMSQTLHLGKSVNDLGFGLFRKWLSDYSVKYDCTIIYCDRWFASSKTCNSCGEIYKPLKLSDRQWVCPCCGTIHDRDRNAACNIRDYFYKITNTAGTAGIHASGDSVTTLKAYLKQMLSLIEEAPSFRLE